MEPAITENPGCFFRAIPIARENVWPAHDDLFIFGDFHFDAGNGLAHIAGLGGNAWVVHRADGGGFRQTIRLEHGNSQH